MRKLVVCILLLILSLIISACNSIGAETPSGERTEDEETSTGTGLKVEAEGEIEELKKESDFIALAEVDGNFETEAILTDAEYDTYQINRIYTATVESSFKNNINKNYTSEDKIEIVYPIGFKQKKDGKLKDELIPFDGEKLLEIESGEYILFLDDLNGKFFFSNINHVYRQNGSGYMNIASDTLPRITIEEVK
ncbi:hypothetical protein [Thalassobacillus hwangdonensis]|uniref:Lipoprotein n=1 Tax=Thalassobacillus hwangdonensis TaxID=546108 RepID=A0ABW3L1A4_9BACI